MSDVSPGSAVYAFADDFLDAGIGTVVDRLVERRFGGVALATVYHAARDVLPHNPQRAVVHREEGAHYFPPDEARYRGRLRPQPASSGTSGFAEVTRAIGDASMWWQAWTVYLHNDRLATANPECAITNAFGDVHVTDLCPSHPDVAAYAVDLTADVAGLRPAALLAESLHHASFEHGYHHERAFVKVPNTTGFLLSLCFCASCAAEAALNGVDSGELADRVRHVTRSSLTGSTLLPAALTREALAELCGPEILGYLQAREHATTRLAAECAAVAQAVDVPFGFIDQTGAIKGYLTGNPQGPLAVDDAWRLGIDPTKVAASCDCYVALAYAKSAARVRDEAAAYAAAITVADLRLVLRHGWPDSVGVDDLRAKVEAVVAVGADPDFYHYGLMPLAGLDDAAAAIAGVTGSVEGLA